MNTFGNTYRLTTFGESHGRAMGGIIDGLPAGVKIDLVTLQAQVDRRRPGQSRLTTQRSEADRVQILSGVMALGADGQLEALKPDSQKGIALGTPIGFMIENSDQHSADYDALRHVCRPSHADYAWNQRYGGIRDWRGGGRSSGRETVSRVVGGAIARQLLEAQGITITSRIASIGAKENPTEDDIKRIVEAAKNEQDSVGGVVECTVSGLQAGVGNPVFAKLQQMLAGAMLSIGAVKGFEYGMGFEGVGSRGSEVADEFCVTADGKVATRTNYSGGIQGGISNGQPIVMRVAVKPTPTISRPLQAVDDQGQEVTLTARGRHDPSILLRVPVVIESMAAMTILDAMLMSGMTPAER